MSLEILLEMTGVEENRPLSGIQGVNRPREVIVTHPDLRLRPCRILERSLGDS